MHDDNERSRLFGRQMRLHEVGREGQLRIEAGLFRVPVADGHGITWEVASAYARAAGMPVVTAAHPDDAPPFPLILADAAARDVATGAFWALAALREAL